MTQRGQSGRGWAPRGGRGSSWARPGDTRNQGGRGRAHRGGRGGGGITVCRNFRTGHCSFGVNCRFSHDLSIEQEPSSPVRDRMEITPERQQARADYNAWKRLLKTPPTPNDTWTMERLWSGALVILDEEDRDWTQMLPRDLDDEGHYGRQHIQTLLGMVAHTNGCREFVDLAHPFLLVITHPALLHCLSVDTFVGNLYNYISGSNGTRAIPFFKRLSTNLVEAHIESSEVSLIMALAGTLVAMSTAICEVLRREPRATFHDDLPDLVDSLENIPEITGLDNRSTAFQILAKRVAELRAMIARAKGLLDHPEEPRVGGVSTTVVASTYPRDIALPGDRHDNDKLDITKIKILPTEDEIRSNIVEFLPSTDPDQPHFLADPADRHRDTLFRLLRHDIFGVLKEALGGLLTAVENDPDLLSNPKLNLGDVQIYSYPNAYIRYVSYNHRRGFEAQISFPQLPSLRRMLPAERRTWWEESRRLEEGTLLCFVSLKGAESSTLLFTVSEKCTAGKDFNLSSEHHQSTIAAKLATYNQIDMESVIDSSCHNTRGALIEFPGVLLATFVPILENLQNMQQQSRLPFRQWILPERIGANGNMSPVLDIPPPLYARGARFTFSLNAILKNSDDDLTLSPNTPIDDPTTIDKLEARTYLDRGQCRALMAALLREFAFIQGPPGTGKSYLGVHLMRVLLSCKSEASLGPILVVCYTNHALDQFLEHLVAVGIEKIIRIGGRSQSAILEGKNLTIVSQGEDKTGSERYLLATTYTDLEEAEKSISKQLRFLHSAQKRPEWANLKRHLAKGYPRIHAQFARVDHDGFEMVGRDPFNVWVSDKLPVKYKEFDDTDSSFSMRELIQLAEQNVQRVSSKNRHRLVENWLQEMREDGTNEVFESVISAELACKLQTDIHDDVNRRVLQTADVIGVTTTGLAKKISTLRHVMCKVVICEEAGEVMEPHMLSALLPSIEHFIQIGDHQQLRAKVNNHSLSLESKKGALYQLDRSQFERLSVGERGRPRLPVAQLDVQRRMRPEISALIRETIYPGLVDHETTRGFPDVVGMRRNVFWLDHNNVEEGAIQDMHQKSHSNLWEVEFTYALVRHIVRQGVYKSSDIAVLTPYTGQLQKLRAKMRNEFEIVLSERDQEMLAKDGFIDEEVIGERQQVKSQSKSEKRPLERKKLSDLLRIATVDNFQGEEAKIIIISLVRSNEGKEVGFLKTTNRINVLLSRAQHGVYLIGNTDTYSNIPMWARVLGMLQATDSVGKALGLCCPRHPVTEIQVRQPDDFARLSPEGGCQLACDRRLSGCGHRCQARCHSESMHQVFPCPQPCQRLHSPCDHGCQKATCGEDCGICLIPLDNVFLPCSHSKDGVPCHQSQDTSKIRCDIPVKKRVPDCGHIIQTQCWRDVASETFSCPVSCEVNLPCGHRCPGSCGHCHKKDTNNSSTIEHRKCTKVCGRRFATCNHTCRKLCHDGTDCGLCSSPCEVRCAHSRCTLRCYEPCAPCIESCTWSCEHRGTCSMPCAAPCARLPCNWRCPKTLPCGHQCPGVCGETCYEDYCHKCANRDGVRVDLLEMKTYGEIDPDEAPIVVLGCGHFFTAETLDGLMGMGEVYLADGNGEFTGLKDVSTELSRSIPRCPDCQRPVRQYATQRYNRMINRAVIDEMSKRFLVNGQDELRELEQQTNELEQSLETTRVEITNSIRLLRMSLSISAKVSKIEKELNERQDRFKGLQKAIQSFCKKFADRHQPAQKLHNATVHAARHRSVNELMANLSLVDAIPATPRDRRVTYRASIAQIRVEHIALRDKFSIVQALKASTSTASIKIPGGNPSQLAKPFFQICKKFIDECFAENLPKLGVEASLYYAGIARPYDSYCRATKVDIEKASEHMNIARVVLERATEMCAQRFENADKLLKAVEESKKLLRKEWYEDVTAEEIAAIKIAMVSGPGGIATHSGHWYNCVNGHPFAIGECGMPMERACCPECGAPVGGQNHEAVDGVTRATSMEVQ